MRLKSCRLTHHRSRRLTTIIESLRNSNLEQEGCCCQHCYYHYHYHYHYHHYHHYYYYYYRHYYYYYYHQRYHYYR